jgi:hypothetical protein
MLELYYQLSETQISQRVRICSLDCHCIGQFPLSRKLSSSLSAYFDQTNQIQSELTTTRIITDFGAESWEENEIVNEFIQFSAEKKIQLQL